MRPDTVANGLQRLGLQFWLREKTAQETGEGVASAALREIWVASGVDENFAAAASNQCLVAFEDDPAIAITAGEFAQSRDPVFLDLGRVRAEQARGFAGMWCEDPTGVERG
jgi:hypothetical protein